VSARRGESGLSGILVVDKPAGMTSHDVVNRVRRATGERRVGHAGTLDPMATGILVVLVGPATRLAPFLTAAEKSYRATIVFGAQTDTDDADGRIIATAPVPDEVTDPFFATGTVAALVGTHQQVPPAFSAIKRGGEVAYVAARRGEVLEIEPRTIEIIESRLVGVDGARSEWDVELAVSKGTYIRAIARDLGPALGTVAHLGSLRRTRSGSLRAEDAVTLDALESAHDVTSLFADPVAALALTDCEVASDQMSDVANGRRLSVDAERTRGQLLSVVHSGRLLAVYEVVDGFAKPVAVIPGGVVGGSR